MLLYLAVRFCRLEIEPAVGVQELGLGQLGVRERHGLTQVERAGAVVGKCGGRDDNGCGKQQGRAHISSPGGPGTPGVPCESEKLCLTIPYEWPATDLYGSTI